MRLSHFVLDRLLTVLPELYRCRSVSGFIHTAVQLASTLISCDGCGWFDHPLEEPPERLFFFEGGPEIVMTPTLARRLSDTAASHPFVYQWQRLGAPAAVMMSDAPSAIVERHVSDNSDIYREIGVQLLSAPITVSPTRAVAISFRKFRHRFTEEDRLVLDLLRPHLAQAFENAQAFDAALQNRQRVMDVVDLTERESEVAFWVALGKTNREIATILGIAPRTVDKHMEHILRKLHVENRTTAALQLQNMLR
jgi:DNA-binding CsgD family transcriptional regulator